MDTIPFEPTVRRAEGTQRLSARHLEEISRLIDARAQSVAELPLRRIKEESRALAPLAKLVQQDAEAATAVNNLQALSLDKRSAAVGGTHVSMDLREAVHPARPGLNIFGPPYDWEVLQPTQGTAATASSDKASGKFAMWHGYGGSIEGYRIATAGVSTALRAEKGGFARIAPSLNYHYEWSLRCFFGLSAFTEGWCEMIVQDGSGSVLPQGRRTVKLWNHTSETSADGEGGDLIYTPDIETTVALAEGQIFHVTLTGTAVVVDSGPETFGYSHATALMRNIGIYFTVTL
ncbi:hypothetical protein [Streptomyces sp. NPDC018031]|uniref:hypothetical protein n=1 Tax=Streptomyces sp. NPDC018031 TaxID=3365033 RepID=UPI0037A1797F